MLEMTDTNAKTPPVKSLTEIPSYLLIRVSHRYNKNMRDALKASGLTTVATRVLVSLAVFKELSVNDLCVYAVAEQPTMSRALDKMEAEGLVTRQAGSEDSRTRIVRLSPAGSALCTDIWPVMAEQNERMMRGIPAEDRAVLLRTMAKMLENIRKNPI
ncbi:MAG: MarR family transcriptional regulator [Rhodobacterales bacterium]|nr:MAG: MarR family transcriptional regulator [Rhodobacterales bacterium]